MEPPDLGGRDPRTDPVDQDQHELDDEPVNEYDESEGYDPDGYDGDDERDYDAADYDAADYDGVDNDEADDERGYDAADYGEYYYEPEGHAGEAEGEPYGADEETESVDEPDGSDDDYYYADDEEEVAAGYVEDDDRDRRRAGFLVPFLLGALAGAVALGMVWGGLSLTGSGESRADTAPQRDAQAAAAHADRVAQCRAVARAQGQALGAARSTLDQWEVHVAAMNRLVVGMITLQQANQFWNQTRRGAARRLTRFLAAEQQVRDTRTATPCPRAPGADASKALRACARSVAAGARALRAADAAVSTWRRHVHDMEMLRTGQMSPAMANRMWLANWHEGVVQLRHYRSAAADTGAGPC